MHASLIAALRGQNQHGKVRLFFIIVDALLNYYNVKSNDIKMLNRSRNTFLRQILCDFITDTIVLKVKRHEQTST